MDVFEAMGTARAMRFLKPDPVPDELVDKVLWAATRASSPNNMQMWDFVVVRDPAVRARIVELFAPIVARFEQYAEMAPKLDLDDTQRRTMAGARNLVSTIGDVPVLIFVCGANVYPVGDPKPMYMYSALYAASQNAVVAARALGLGAVFTTLHDNVEPGLRELLAVPDDRTIGTTLALGWPDRPFGPVTRRPLEEVVHHDRW